jgi:hypothetical protein
MVLVIKVGELFHSRYTYAGVGKAVYCLSKVVSEYLTNSLIVNLLLTALTLDILLAFIES